ncbi:SAM-dependent methyltransferase [Vibrio vulnificus]|uniref:tRNA (adenine(22)-N(1))-methyltransferase n=1 Tax=Vibrio vulnificus TaxID=672 RepID=UPI000CD13499|nr:tRNA (adenine(22)-N(1))-methyltransferase TrmK [Vibrio vulnificus]EGQ7698938.1 SAM-dependent methyltransferase [Vibrio vulnificus]EGQ7956265.1 SAM-dependent methyltransferase [Vibrio vulnificus]EGQ7987282.1 SAM-dependent methyltransferase [Vibrio vulnificus]EGQ8172023.1 SAM-dependent methyltransferase [Vibrio vulnificus]EGQ9236263.1 SAM-dependent methyltransferase [Vibrio vulnificus]
MKLSKRIQAVAEMVNQEYDHIWDCCCDHGYLGFELLRRSPSTTVHFVDIVPTLTDKISHTLAQFGDVQAANWQVHCMDVGDLPHAKHTGKHLIIIAGVGGDLALDLVKRIQDNHPHSELEFLLCPVHHLYTLRDALHGMNFRLIAERLVEDNRRFYEILHISNAPAVTTPISVTGEQLWHEADSRLAVRYQQKTIAHYERLKRGHGEEIERIIQAYQQVKLAQPH